VSQKTGRDGLCLCSCEDPCQGPELYIKKEEMIENYGINREA